MLDGGSSTTMAQRPVRYTLKSLDIRYELAFRTPFFSLPRTNLDTWDAFYKHLAPRFIVQSSDFHAVGGTVLSQETPPELSIWNAFALLR